MSDSNSTSVVLQAAWVNNGIVEIPYPKGMTASSFSADGCSLSSASGINFKSTEFVVSLGANSISITNKLSRSLVAGDMLFLTLGERFLSPSLELTNGLKLGKLGGADTIYDGFKLVYGDDFTGDAVEFFNPITKAGTYGVSAPVAANRRVAPSASERAIYVDKSYKGSRSQSVSPLPYQPLTVKNSVLTITAQPVPAGLYDYLPTTYTQGGGDGNSKPVLISGALKTWPSFMIAGQGDFIMECSVKFASGMARGYWPSFWCTTLNWPDFGEIDLVEGRKDAGGNVNVLMNFIASSTDGGAVVFDEIALTPMPVERFVHLVSVKKGKTIQFYDDSEVAGTLKLRASFTSDRVLRLKGAQDIRLELAVSSHWDSSAFTASDWPKTVEFDWFKIWALESTEDNQPLKVMGATQLMAGDTWNYKIPSDDELFGSGVDFFEVYAAFFDEDSVGAPLKFKRLPANMVVDKVARTITGAIPYSEAGRVGVLMLGTNNAGGAVKRAIHYYDVAPVVQGLFSSLEVAVSTAVNRTINYSDFHSGNLGPHTYYVKKTGGAWLNVAGNGTGTITLTGNAPAGAETVTLTISCTNILGQETTVTRNINVVAAVQFRPDSHAQVIEWWDANDNTTVYSTNNKSSLAVANASNVSAIEGKKSNLTFYGTDDATKPNYIIDAVNGKRAIKFNRAVTSRLIALDLALVNNVTGDDNEYAVIAAIKRGAPVESVTPFGFSGNERVGSTHFIRHYVGSANNVGVQRLASETLTIGSAGGALPANQWYVVAWIYTAKALTVRVNGVVVANAVSMDSSPLSVGLMSLGSLFLPSNNDFDATTAFDGAIGEFVVTNNLATNDAVIPQIEAYLAAKWTN